ncbi:hypothetical protein SFyv_6334 [Shigella flexneri Shi06HN006]|nr:hypothetical protein SFy_6262 [Shigella flexneri 2003036]AIL43700.1 hypothetical protein SFyv_6334 [Shigella flexneri Shi06HN006]EGJ79513.1 hypothetical protein SFK671_5134 [Shigella flexneri K-671]EGJ79777.1 hypothetical protein SF434370_4723 [Shigella flexneri 4343-70]EIQ19586.1 hypothetical protein SFK404_5554 [Shigella flexneri K-404]EJL09751.1 hypothetical protein SF660363_5025 [Shigella flexneri 6603-63]SRN48473.1 Uncharacterised protein [Shigella flexneri]
MVQHDVSRFYRSACRNFTTYDDFTVPEFDLLSDLRCVVPACIENGWHNAFGNDVCFRQVT